MEGIIAKTYHINFLVRINNVCIKRFGIYDGDNDNSLLCSSIVWINKGYKRQLVVRNKGYNNGYDSS